MTAKTASRLAMHGVWGTLRTLGDQWVLLVFFGTALFWARDVYEQFIDLPARVTEMQSGLIEIRSDIQRLDEAFARPHQNREPVLSFPGTRHRIADGAPGRLVFVELAPVQVVRDDCTAHALSGFMIDARGTWYTVDLGISQVPHLSDRQDLAFEVRVHPRMAQGRATFLVEIASDCGTHVQIDRSPTLPFRVIRPAHR